MREGKPKKKMTVEAAKLRLEALCAQSEQCSMDLRQKLYRWEISASDSETILKHLIDLRFVDDARFAVAYCRDKCRFNHWGKIKLAYGLRSKRIPSQYIQEALNAIAEDEYIQILESVIRIKAKTIKDIDTYEGRTKLFRYVASRGFEIDLISDIIKNRDRWLSAD